MMNEHIFTFFSSCQTGNVFGECVRRAENASFGRSLSASFWAVRGFVRSWDWFVRRPRRPSVQKLAHPLNWKLNIDFGDWLLFTAFREEHKRASPASEMWSQFTHLSHTRIVSNSPKVLCLAVIKHKSGRTKQQEASRAALARKKKKKSTQPPCTLRVCQKFTTFPPRFPAAPTFFTNLGS